MSFHISRTLLYSAIGIAIAGQAQAAALKLELFIDGQPAGQTQVLLDGEPLGSTGPGGKFWSSEVPGGGHQLQMQLAGKAVPYEFTLSDSQAALITVNADSASGRTVKSIQKLDLSELDSQGAQLSTIDPDNLAPGLIQGAITIAGSEQPLRNVTVTVQGSGQQTVTDRYGNFELELPPGVYQLQLEHPQYRSSRLSALRVLPRIKLALEAQLSPLDTTIEGASPAMEEIQVVGRYLPGNPIEIERISSAVVDSIDFTQIARFGDSMVSSALKRMVGVSMEDDRFAVVRGMKGRYQSVEFNGASLPSTDPARRDLPFDIFPAGIMQSLSLQKSATADVPLSATAGHISMRTKDIPEEAFFKISYSATHGDSHGDDLLMSSTEGDRDWLGMDDGSRELPDILKPTGDSFINPRGDHGFDEEALETLGEAVPHNAIYYGEAQIDSSLSFNGGDSWELGEQRLGVIGALRYANKWSSNTKDNSRFSAYNNGSEPYLILDSEAETLDTNNVIDLSAMLNLQWDIGENHRLGLNNIALRHTTNSSELEKVVSTSGTLGNFNREAVERLRNGEDTGLKTNPDAKRFWRQRVEWIEEQLVSHQLWGAHSLDISADSGWSLYLGDLGLEWQAMTASTEYDRPNATQYSYEANDSSQGFRFGDEPGDQYNIWEDMQEENQGYRLDLELPVEEIGGVSLLFKAGADVLQRDRDGSHVRYSYRMDTTDQNDALSGGIPDPRKVFVPENITGSLNGNGNILGVNSFSSITPETDVGMVGDDYISELETSAQYALVEANILEKFKVNLGVRKETFKLDAEQFVFAPEPLTNLMDEERTSPSLGLTWVFNDAWQLRAAWSETVNWPEVFEIIPRSFADIETLEKFTGNPELKPADIENVDLRLEWYPSDRESVTLALFRKELTNAIENRFSSIGQVYNYYTFDNAEQAEVEGVELDLRREFVLGRDQGHELFVQFNYTYITSSVDLTEGFGVGERDVNRPLQGQPDSIANLQLGYDHVDSGQEVTLVFNRMGEELAITNSAGTSLVGDVYRQPYADLRLIYKKKFLNGLSLAASVDNLLDEEHNLEYADFNVPYLSYESGRKFKLSASYEF